MKLKVILICTLGFVSTKAIAQDLSVLFSKEDSLSASEAIKENTDVSGNIAAEFATYNVNGIQSRRDPYNWALGGNLNVRSMEIELPFSFYFTNQNTDFRQPFNQFGVSPKYKWITAHLGYRNLNWSEFTLAGHTFLGAGIEVNPGILRAGLVYGRFRSAAEPENELGQIPSYKRMGYAFKVGVGTETDYIDFIVFRAQDDVNSLKASPDSAGIYPAENLTIGLHGRKKITDAINAQVEVARSAFTDDIRSDETQLSGSNGAYNNLGFAFTPRESTNYNNAMSASINWSPKKFKAGLKYRRIEGEYQSMGAYFFNNDLEDITINLGLPLANNKVNFNGSFGIQRNNLNDDKISQTQRIIGSANVFWLISQKLSTGLTYSNYSSNLRTVRDQISDSINFYQVTNTANAFANYNFGTSDRQQSLMLNLGAQQANARQEYTISDVQTNFRNAALNYRINFKNGGFSLNAGANYTGIEAGGINTVNIGPMAGLSKNLMDEKITVRFNHSLIHQTQNGTAASLINLSRFGISYKPFIKHQFDAGTTLMHKNAQLATISSFTELRAIFGYRYTL